MARKTYDKLTRTEERRVRSIAKLLDSPSHDMQRIGDRCLDALFQRIPQKQQHIDQILREEEGTGTEADWKPVEDQYDYLCNRFYSTTTTGGQRIFYIRRHEEALPDEKINGNALLSTVHNRFGYICEAVLEAWSELVPVTVAREYLPNGKKIEIRHDAPYANTWVPPLVKPATHGLPPERPALWQEYLDRLMPREHTCWWTYKGEKVEVPQQDYFEAWLAQRVRHPEQDNTVSVVLRGTFGTGKGYWMDTIASELVGTTNYKSVTTKDWKGDFNGDMFQSVIIHLEETKDTKQNTTEMLKKLITQQRQRSNEKNLPQRHVERHFSVVITSNYKVPVAVDKGDRRFFIPVFSRHLHEDDEGLQGKHETSAFIQELDDWLKLKGGFQILRNWLQNVRLDRFPFRMAPDTKDKMEIWSENSAFDSQQSQIVIELMDRASEKWLYTSVAVAQHYRITDVDAQAALRQAGYKSVQKRFAGSDGLRLWMPIQHAKETHLAKKGWRLWRAYGGYGADLPQEDEGASSVEAHKRQVTTGELELLRSKFFNGETCVANANDPAQAAIIALAREAGRLVKIGRHKGRIPDNGDGFWGNPFVMPKDGDRDQVCIKHKTWLDTTTKGKKRLQRLHELKGKMLVCHCYPERCHGDYLAEMAEKLRDQSEDSLDTDIGF